MNTRQSKLRSNSASRAPVTRAAARRARSISEVRLAVTPSLPRLINERSAARRLRHRRNVHNLRQELAEHQAIHQPVVPHTPGEGGDSASTVDAPQQQEAQPHPPQQVHGEEEEDMYEALRRPIGSPGGDPDRLLEQ